MRALVTGGNGHLGLNLVGALLARGHTVRTSVRSLADTTKTAALRALRQQPELVEADVRDAEKVRAALRGGIDTLFHVAAVYSVTERAREADMLESAIAGTETVLRAAAAEGVRRVVMTSTVVVLPLTEPGAPPSTEADWNTDLRVPYFRAKVESERLAWALAGELELELATILPAAIIGPGFARPTPTINLVICALRGGFRFGVPRGNFAFADVRDVAEAHVLAAERGAHGRFMVGYDAIPTYDQFVRALAAIDRRVEPPLMVLPAFAAPLATLVDRFNHLVRGTPRVATPEAVASTVSGKVYNYTCARAKRELGWSARIPFERSLADTVAQIDRLAAAARGAAAPH